MTIRFLKPWNGYQPDQVATLAGGVETTLINGGIAVGHLTEAGYGDYGYLLASSIGREFAA